MASKMATKRESVPRPLEKRLYQEVGSRCAQCGQSDVSLLIVHHIIQYAAIRRHEYGNMIVLCRNCHEKADRREITPDELFETKRRLAASNRVTVSKRKAQRSLAVSGVVAAGRDINVDRDIVVKYGEKKKSKIVVPGSVAEDKWKLGYLKYLGHRYNELKTWDIQQSGKRMQYWRIWKAYRNKIKFNLEETPTELFDDGAAFLQFRIRNTRIGRLQQKKGMRLYQSFSEYSATAEGRPLEDDKSESNLLAESTPD